MAEDRMVRMEWAVALLNGRQRALKKELAREKRRLESKSENIRAAATTRIAEITPAIADLDAQIETKELELTFEEAARALQQAHNAFLEGQQRALEAGAGKPVTERVLASRLEELESIRSTARLLEKRAKELADVIRKFIQTSPKGWMRSDDSLKRYLAWFGASGDLFAFLKDNPVYSVTPDQVVTLLGMARATPFFAVAYPAFEKQVRGGLLKDSDGEVITMERLVVLRQRTVRTPSVETRRRGAEQPIEDLLDLLDPQYAEGDGDDISVLALDHATEKALRAAEIHRVGQLRRSGDDLTNIPGIGEKRAGVIHDALVKRKKAA